MNHSWKTALALAALLLAGHGQAHELKTVSIPSKAMGTSSNAVVVMPDAYKQGNQRFPVVYVLHGWSGNAQSWTDTSKIAALADQYKVILVAPDGAYDKWYIDSPGTPKVKYETYVGKEVVDYIDRNFNTIAKKEARAITGLSMGGFGALNIAVNHPDLFGAVGSTSGGVDPRDFAKNWGMEAVFGDRVKNAEFWNQKAIVNNAHRFIFSGIDMIIDCGVDDFFIKSNRDLHDKLLELRIAHDYIERPGGHSWDYWDNSIKFQVLYFATKFAAKLSKDN